jgi:hypothetical protein
MNSQPPVQQFKEEMGRTFNDIARINYSQWLPHCRSEFQWTDKVQQKGISCTVFVHTHDSAALVK